MFIHIKFFIIYIFLFLVETVIKSFHDVSMVFLGCLPDDIAPLGLEHCPICLIDYS